MNPHFKTSEGQSADTSSISIITFTAIVAPVAYLCIQYFYNIYFHALKNYPGPLFAAASRIPLTWSIISGASVHWIQDLHSRYGDVVRVGPNELSYANAQAWKDINGHRKAGQPSFLRDPRFYTNPENPAADDIITADDAGHARMRRIFSNAFSDKALKLQEPLFKQYVDLLIQKLHQVVQKEPNHEFDMVKMYNFTTFDIMGDLTFGEPLYLLEGSQYTPWIKNILGNLRIGSIMRALRYFPLLQKVLEACVPKSLKEQRKAHFQFSVDRVNRRLAKEATKPDIWDLVLKKKESEGLTPEEMHGNSSVFMIAGTETTATLLSGLTYYLLKNPDKMKKLTDEIRGAFATDADIGIERLAELKYTQACIEEGLRKYPPVPIGLPRNTPSGGAEIIGRWVPPKTTVYVSQYATYHNPKNFKDPFSFIPERWMSNEAYASDQKSALQPFSTGPRNCLGKNMAYHEIRLILANVLWHFDLSLCKESDNWADQLVFTLWQKGPLMVKLTPVKR